MKIGVAGLASVIACALTGAPATARPLGRVSTSPALATSATRVVPARQRRLCTRARLPRRKLGTRCASAGAPKLSVHADTLSWTATARRNQYVLSVKLPGDSPNERIVVGRTATPRAHPGLAMEYAVRARAQRLWSNVVWITYPSRARKGESRQTGPAARPRTGVNTETEAQAHAKIVAERQAREKPKHEGPRERAEREAREKAELEAKQKVELEAKQKAELEAKERAAREAREREEAERKGSLTFTPTVIPLSAPEIPNTGRGLYDWQGERSMTPPGWPLVDYYQRDEIDWARDLEPSKGVYPFLSTPGVIDQGLAMAAAKGGKLRFRVMAWVGSGSPRYPSYIPTLTSGGYTFPDWNSEVWLTAWEGLWRALGQKYGSDPRVGEVDTSGYGAWGEWHMCPSTCITTAGSHITTANGVRMVAAVVKAFPKAHVVLSTSAAIKDDSPLQPPLMPAIIKAFPTVGFHMDNFGAVAPADGNYLPLAKPGGAVPNLEIWERWKTAPVVAEWWALSSATLANAKQSEEEFHVGMIGSGNNPSQIWKTNPAQYEEIIKRSGFRYQLDRVEVTPLTAGHATILTTTWENVNVAPTYDPWEVRYELRNGENIAWSARSALDLRELLPTEGKPVKATDTLTLPAGLPKGNYTLAVQVADATNTVAPMRLADTGRTNDGAYPLGTVTVN
jgi:hypothetical protein